MNFNSLSYAIFLPIVFMIYWRVPHRFRWGLLLLASYYFYMSWNPQYIVLILGTTIVSFFAAIFIEKYKEQRMRKYVLILASVVCIAVLFFFKYYNFFSNSLVIVLKSIAIDLHPATLDVLLPVGISFYTFQTMSYMVDVYRGDVKAERHFGEYATFISFFPQLVAGPIERTRNLLPQIKSVKNFNYEEAAYGLRLMAWGFFKKLVVADNAAIYVDAVYASLDKCTGFDLLTAVLLFTFQIYCDFSGYSDIAIGTARLLGIKLMTNFKSPYLSASLKEFWGRWHISLSTWFRDYLYIPLGGSRCSRFRHSMNLMITFLVSGLWHGASWTFVFWGGIHGLVQVIENQIGWNRTNKNGLNRVLSILSIFIICNIAWVFFRAETINDAMFIIGNLVIDLRTPAQFLDSGIDLHKNGIFKVLIAATIVMVYDWKSLKMDVLEYIASRTLVVRWCIYVLVVYCIIIMMPVETSSFIYFQF